MVWGPAGSGKTALVRIVADELGNDDRRTLRLAATDSLHSVPFGAFAPLLGDLRRLDPNEPSQLGGAKVLATAYEALRDTVAGAVLVVDDVHLLDDGSARLLSLVVARSDCVSLLTTRTGEPLEPSLERLWKDGDITPLHLEPLSDPEIETLCGAALGGFVEARTRKRLVEASAGNLLYLRELLRGGVESGHLRAFEQVWEWIGPMTIGGPLTEVILGRLLAAGPDVLRVLRIVSLGEPLELEIAQSLCPDESIDRAVRLGFVAIERRGRRDEVRVGHPLFGQTLAGNEDRRDRRDAAAELAEAILRSPLRRGHDHLRLAVLEMWAGAASDVGRLTSAASQARQLGDLGLAVALARFAVETDAGPEARLELLECLFWQGCHDEALAIAAGLESQPLTEADTVALAISTASIRYFSRGELDLALELLESTERGLPDPWRARVRAHRAEILMFAGHVGDAAIVGTEVLSVPTASTTTRAVGFGAVVPSLALAGRVVDAQRMADDAMAFLVDQPDPPFADGAGVVVGGFLSGLLGSGLADSTALVELLRQEALGHPSDPMLAIWSLLLGRAALAVGPLSTAVEMLGEAVIHLRREDPSRLLSWALGSVAQAHGMRGDPVAATRAVHEMDRTAHHHMKAFELDREMGRAWAAASAGRVDEARRTALAIRETAMSHQAWGVAACAQFEAFRLGVGRAQLRDTWPSRVELQGPLLPLAVEVATRRHGVDELLGHADQLRALGATLWALDVGAVALRNSSSTDGAATHRATYWLADAMEADPTVRTPAILDARDRSGRTPLTPRERDVVRLVMLGRTNAEIADDLFLSKRTVESHLRNVFLKLGVSSRHELGRQHGTTAT